MRKEKNIKEKDTLTLREIIYVHDALYCKEKEL